MAIPSRLCPPKNPLPRTTLLFLIKKNRKKQGKNPKLRNLTEGKISGTVRPMTMERDVAKLSFQTIKKKNRLKILSHRRYGESGKEMFVF